MKEMACEGCGHRTAILAGTAWHLACPNRKAGCRAPRYREVVNA